MSLINEALMKARAQVAQQSEQDADPDMLVETASPYVPRRKAGRSVAVTVGLAGAMLMLAVVLIVSAVHMLSRPQSATAQSAAVKPEENHAKPAQIETSSPSEAQLVEVRPLPQPAIEPPPLVEQKAEDAPVDVAPPDAAQPVAVKVERTAPKSAATNNASGPAHALRGRTFVKVIDQPNLPRLRLEGIVWSPTAPVALLNGTMVRPGDETLGFKVVAVRRNKIKLEMRGSTFFLRMP